MTKKEVLCELEVTLYSTGKFATRAVARKAAEEKLAAMEEAKKQSDKRKTIGETMSFGEENGV